MAKRNKIVISRKMLGGMVLVGVLVQYLLPQIGIGFLAPLALALYLIVGLYLFLF